MHERPCFICFVVWPTSSLKLYIVFWDGIYRNASQYRLPSKNAPVTVYHYNDTRSTVTRWSFDNVKRHVTAFRPISEAAHNWSYDRSLCLSILFTCISCICSTYQVENRLLAVILALFRLPAIDGVSYLVAAATIVSRVYFMLYSVYYCICGE